MDLEFNLGSGGDATAETPSADTGVDASVSAETPVFSTEPTTDLTSGAETPAEPTPEQAEQAPQEPVDEEAELLAAANDPNTPRWAREKIQQAMGYANRLKTDFETKAKDYETRFAGQAPIAQPELERLQAAESALFEIQSITATPDLIDAKLRELNPQVYEQYQNHLVWNALAKPDGSPDLDNLQAVVDKFAGEPGTVAASDVLQAVQALKTGKITREDFHEFESAEAYQAYQRQQAIERELQEKTAKAEENLIYQEKTVREQYIQQAFSQVQQQLDSQIAPLMEKFKLTPVQGEPPIASKFKTRVNERIASVVNNSGNIREIAELKKSFELLANPRKVDAATAANEVRQFTESPRYQQYVSKGLSAVASEVEKVVAEEAQFYALAMLGLEVQNSRGQNARPVPGSPNQASANNQGLTPEQLARMTAAEREEAVMLDLSNKLRANAPAYGNTARGIG